MIFKTHLSTLFIIFLLTATGLYAQSNIPHSAPADYISQFQDIYVDAAGIGFVGGECGVLRKTTNAGQSWTTESSPTENEIHSIACKPSGCDKALMITDDGLFRFENDVWTDVTYEDYYPDGQLHWLTEDIVLHETTSDNFYRSVDGGLTWEIVALPDFQASNMTLFDDGTGYFFIDKSLYGISNQWSTVDSLGFTHSTNIYKTTWLDSNNGWFFDQDRFFYATTDAGTNWTLLNSESQLSSVNWMVALSSTHIVGAQIVDIRIESLDGGVTWTRSSFLEGDNKRVNRKYHRLGDAFYLVGSQSQLLYSEAGFADFVELDPFGRFERISHLAFVSDDIGYALDGTQLTITTDSGLNWTNANLDQAGRDMAVLDDGSVIVLTNGSNWISSDQGTTFAPWIENGVIESGENPLKFSQMPNGNIYLMSSNYGYLSTDGGANFTAINTAHEFSPTGLFFLDDNNGYAVSRQAQFMSTTDGGQTWTRGEDVTNNLVDVYFTDADNGWASTASRRYITTDRGLNWTNDSNVGGYDFSKNSIDGSMFVSKYASGNNGEFKYSEDNGATWNTLAYNCFAYRSGALTPSGKYFFTGGDGFIVRHDIEQLTTSTRRVAQKQIESLKAFPNPTAGVFEIEIPSSSNQSFIEVYDNQGRLQKQIDVEFGDEKINLSVAHLPNGVYWIRWTDKEQVGVSKIVKM